MPIKITVLNDFPVFRYKPLDVITVTLNQSTHIDYDSRIFDLESHDIYMTAW